MHCAALAPSHDAPHKNVSGTNKSLHAGAPGARICAESPHFSRRLAVCIASAGAARSAFARIEKQKRRVRKGTAMGEYQPQRIFNIRRDYNAWVANETLEDYALRFAPRSFRKWSAFRVANTAFGSISFLVLEAIGGALTITYGFENACWAILAVGLVIFLTGFPIAYYAAKYNIDMDLLTRGAGFGYIGSTLTSLIYASFTFTLFALEASIMSLALQLYLSIPLWIAHLISAIVVIPLVTYGITNINRLQLWTQPLWLLLLALLTLANLLG